MSTESWRTLKAGECVRVEHPVSDMERTLLGREYTIERMEPTHGYAVCRDAKDGAAWWIHPEALERTATWEVWSRDDGLEGVFASGAEAHSYAAQLLTGVGAQCTVKRIPRAMPVTP